MTNILAFMSALLTLFSQPQSNMWLKSIGHFMSLISTPSIQKHSAGKQPHTQLEKTKGVCVCVDKTGVYLKLGAEAHSRARQAKSTAA